MPPASVVTLPIALPPDLMEQVKAAAASVSPGKRVKIALTLGLDGTITASAGVRAGKFVTIGAFAARSAGGGVNGAAQAVIEFAPEP